MKKTLLILFAVFCALPPVFARDEENDSAEAWEGTWKRSDGGQTMTISFKGSTATISYSKGTPDTGKLRADGQIMDFEGSTHGGYDHSQGTLVLSSDSKTITKHQTIFAQDGPEKHLQATYVRSSQSLLSSSTSEEVDSSSSSQDAAKFVGRWRADDNPDAVLTIKIHGSNVTLISSLAGSGTKTGTLRDGVIEYRVSSTQRGSMEYSGPGHITDTVTSAATTETESYTRIR